MNILIVEDEPYAAKRMVQLLKTIRPNAQIAAQLDGVESTVAWLKENEVDLIMLDIHLSDGSSFLIFDRIEVKTPIIFTTAYDEYAIKAFKVNSVDYLLKPIVTEELVKSIEKFESFGAKGNSEASIMNIIKELRHQKPEFKDRFLVRKRDRLLSVLENEIFFFVSEDKYVFLVTPDSKYMIDYTLDQLEGMLNPKLFFRINRQYIAHFQSIDQVYNHLNGKLKILLNTTEYADAEIYVSRERASDFKKWLGQ